MKRIMLVVTAALAMATMMVAMAMPAFAAPPGCTSTEVIDSNCVFAGGYSEQSGLFHGLVNLRTGTYLYQIVYNDHGTDLQEAYTCRAALESLTDTTCHGTIQTPR
jgi:hypothetical protein